MKINNDTLDLRINNIFNKGNKFVELGCGAGFAIDKLSKKYNIAIGIDISRDRLKLRKEKKINKWKFIAHDLNQKLPLASNDIDGVYANQVVEHIINPNIFFKEIYRILNKSGTAVITTPNIRYIKHIINLVFSGYGPRTANANIFDGDWDDGHLHYFTHSDLILLAQQAGFKTIKSYAFINNPEKNFLRKLLNRLSFVPIIKEFFSGNIIIILKK